MKLKRIVIILLTVFYSVSINNSASSSLFTPNDESFSKIVSQMELFNNHINTLYSELGLRGKMDMKIFKYSIIGYYNLKRHGQIKNDSILTIIDYEKPSNEKRLYVINLSASRIQCHTLVAHGMNTGNVYAERFSNRSGSKQSSIGFFVTGGTYSGKHDYSLKLIGLDPLYNSNVLPRGVVFHGANYVSEDYIARNGRLGRSFGCPALPADMNKEIINTIKGGSCVFIYYPDEDYLHYTSYLDEEAAAGYCYGDRDFSSFEKAEPISSNINVVAYHR